MLRYRSRFLSISYDPGFTAYVMPAIAGGLGPSSIDATVSRTFALGNVWRSRFDRIITFLVPDNG